MRLHVPSQSMRRYPGEAAEAACPRPRSASPAPRPGGRGSGPGPRPPRRPTRRRLAELGVIERQPGRQGRLAVAFGHDQPALRHPREEDPRRTRLEILEHATSRRCRAPVGSPSPENAPTVNRPASADVLSDTSGRESGGFVGAGTRGRAVFGSARTAQIRKRTPTGSPTPHFTQTFMTRVAANRDAFGAISAGLGARRDCPSWFARGPRPPVWGNRRIRLPRFAGMRSARSSHRHAIRGQADEPGRSDALPPGRLGA